MRIPASLTWSIFLWAALITGCTHTVTSGTFMNPGRIDNELKKGVSTKIDAEKVLGRPKGFGSALLPTESVPREVWFYEDIEATDATSLGSNTIRVKVRQQFLLLFFQKELYDGYLWVSNVGVGSADVQ